MKIVNCIDVPSDWIHQAFQVGFSDYIVKMEFSKEEFVNRFFGPEGNQLEHSFIVLDDERPIGLILGGIKDYEGLKTLRCGTLCIHPDYRRKGVARRLFELHKKDGMGNGCKQLYLEVIVGNEQAIRFYEKHGYNKIYDLKYFHLKNTETIHQPQSSNIVPIAIEQLRTLRQNMLDVHLNWQNDIEYIEIADGQHHFGVYDKSDLVGGISVAQSGRISFLWIHIDCRGNGLATDLIAHCIRQLQLKSMTASFPNHAGLEGFYQRLGFERASLSQYEMYLSL